MNPVSDLSSWRLSVVTLLASTLTFVGCGLPEGANPDDFTTGDESSLTRPLESGVPRRTYGNAKQERVYFFTVDSCATGLNVDLSGSGRVNFKVEATTSYLSCFRYPSQMEAHCAFNQPTVGKWAITVTGVTDFSGSLVATAVGCDTTTTEDAGTSTDHGPRTDGQSISKHTTMGFPAEAKVGDATSWLLVKPQYVVSFNTKTKTPNWVSWQLTNSWLGPAARTPNFTTDSTVPTANQATNPDFDNTGYARGHMCPSSDRTDTDADNKSTFVLTNVVPQVPTLNNGPWKGLENEGRQLATLGKTLFITSGPILGTTTIGAGVNVPVATWKVVVVLDSANATAANVTANTRVIAVIMPNNNTATGDWTTYRTTVREIEKRTGLDLLSDVATAVQNVVETRVDDGASL